MINLSLKKKDYLSILNYYNIDSQGLTYQNMKKTAENILANKLCRCIKKVDNYYKANNKNKNSNDIIRICKNSVFTKKKISYYKFKCKKRPRLLSKTRKKLKLFKT
jgi:hypothetical protein